MGRKSRNVILACNGLDGACAAATALLKFPEAELVITSASSVAYSLGLLEGGAMAPAEIHVCGLGVRCDWERLAGACGALREKGARIYWYCGRGYLDDIADGLREICSPVLAECASNTEAVAGKLGLDGVPRAEFLKNLALHDRALDLPDAHRAPEEEFWCDFVNGSSLQYFKFMDRNAYSDAIRKLAAGEEDEQARRIAEIYRKAGAKYMLAGRSRALSRLKERVRKCAEADEPVLVTGESGVGKEWVAHLLHERSSRATEAFVPVNCATFAGNLALANSDLFGHVKGAFTGADENRMGKILSADGGILFLDEVGELPPEVQAKLLRVLEDGEVFPLGSDKPAARVDVRVIAATNRNLPEMLKAGRFREDFFYRLNVLTVRVPPLREHSHDIYEIARKTLAEIPLRHAGARLSKEDIETLREYEWPGNVRQLIQVIKRWAYLGEPMAKFIEEERGFGYIPDRAGEKRGGWMPESAEDVKALKEVQGLYAQRALELHGGNKKATAKALGISVNTLKNYLSA